MPDIQTLFVAGITAGFVAFGAVLLGVSLWSGREPKKKRDSRA